MIDYTPEGMLKRIETLEQIVNLQQETIDNLITCIETRQESYKELVCHLTTIDHTIKLINDIQNIHSSRFESLEKTVGNLLKGNY